MKKFVAFVMVCAFAVAMVACSQKKAEDTTDTLSTKADSVADSTVNSVADSVKEIK